MTTKQRLYLSVAAIGMFALLAGAPVQLSAQTAAQTTVAIDDNEIGGVVTGANGPEAGVWVIAETTELPTKFAQHRRHRRSGPLPHPRSADRELQRLGARLRSGRFAQAAPQSRASISISPRCRRRTKRRRRIIIRRSTGTR